MISPKLTLELQPMDPPKRDASDANGPPTLELVPAGPAGAAALSAAAEIDILPLSTKRVVPPPTEKPDRFMAEAAHQYAEGHLDQPLWDRAFTQANGDKEAAVAAYLQARAIALKLLDREKRSQRHNVAAQKVNKEIASAEELEGFDVEAALRHGRDGILAKYRTGIMVGAILLATAVAAWFAYSLIFSKPAQTVVTAPPAAASKARAPAVAATARDGMPAVARKPIGATPELLKKIQELRDAGSCERAGALPGGMDAQGTHQCGSVGPAACRLCDAQAIRRCARGGEESAGIAARRLRRPGATWPWPTPTPATRSRRSRPSNRPLRATITMPRALRGSAS